MTAPDEIWADPPEIFDGMDIWRSEPGGKGIHYVRRDPAVLAALPEVQALIRAAVEKETERCAKKVDEWVGTDLIAAAIRGAKP